MKAICRGNLTSEAFTTDSQTWMDVWRANVDMAVATGNNLIVIEVPKDFSWAKCGFEMTAFIQKAIEAEPEKYKAPVIP
jgi:hypothetical protein